METRESLIQREYLETPVGKIAYFRYGQGFPLVLLHSLALNADMWTWVLDDFADKFEVICVDLRGHGQSAYDGKAFTIENMAWDVKLLVDSLGLHRINLLGMSMGGCVAISFATTYPDYVERLALCDTTPWYGEQAVSAWQARATIALEKPRLLQIPFQSDRWFCDSFRRNHPEVVAHVVRLFLDTKPKVHAHACHALGSFDARENLVNISAPTLVMTGEEDGATPPSMGRYLADNIPNASFVLCQGLRHFAVLESRDVRLNARNHFLDSGTIAELVNDTGSCCNSQDHPTIIDPEENK